MKFEARMGDIFVIDIQARRSRNIFFANWVLAHVHLIKVNIRWGWLMLCLCLSFILMVMWVMVMTAGQRAQTKHQRLWMSVQMQTKLQRILLFTLWGKMKQLRRISHQLMSTWAKIQLTLMSMAQNHRYLVALRARIIKWVPLHVVHVSLSGWRSCVICLPFACLFQVDVHED